MLQNASPCANPFLIPGKSVDGPAIEWNMNDFPRSCPFVNKDIGVFDKDPLRKFDVNEGYPKVNPSFFSLRHTSISWTTLNSTSKLVSRPQLRPQATIEVFLIQILSPRLYSS